MLKINQLSVRYPKAKEFALKDISVAFKKGEFVCILGKSGAGKSTFIRCLNGLQQPTSGEVIWQGKEISGLKEKELRHVRKEIGMIFQHFNLIPRLSVLQNVLTGTFGGRDPMKNLFGIFSEEEKKVAYQAIADVELADFAERRVEALSGGQKQRVGIARALVQQPKLFLGDEPVASLDPGTSNKIFQLLQRFHYERELLTIINVHDVNIAQRYATRIIALKQGELIFDGKPEQFSESIFHEIYDTEKEDALVSMQG
ncbi:phosphonate ABC transporter ATP-binding protein [Anaerobacillus sp. MEB173]|uniref:phosphonate ABC transporter ATP-binding protein n=1 Tax=Anaerobacillus sp. MEB173 TaxID=3383345 RepID=UPI003F8EAF94